MSQNGEALADVTNKVANIQVNEEAVKRVREAQWVEPQKFNYDAYNAGPRDAGPSGPTADADAKADAPSWAANGMKYEWLEEYGDVAPRYEALEAILFHDKDKMKKGNQFQQ